MNSREFVKGELMLDAVTVYRSSDDGSRQPVVESLTLLVSPGERCMLVGPNGAGKTSLLLATVGALPFSGSIRVGPLSLDVGTLERVRQRVGFVFANPDEQLFCETVHAEVAFGPQQLGYAASEIDAGVQRALDQVGLRQHARKNPHHLSLGEQRRVAIAAAIATEPELLLLDEPTASLDPLARETILDTLRHTAATLVIASHDLNAARELGATVVLLNHGRLVGAGAADRVLADHELLVRAGLRSPG
jgi:energy-coupling factor transporter ATP-binding protein EcfA2